MSARILEGKVFAQAFREDAQKKAAALREQYGVQPGLAVIIVGSNPASQVYVRNKHKSCEALGIYSEVIEMPETTTKDELIAKIDALNTNSKIHGILVQLPLPGRLPRMSRRSSSASARRRTSTASIPSMSAAS